MKTVWLKVLTGLAVVSLMLLTGSAGTPAKDKKKKDVKDTKTGKVLDDTAKGNRSADSTFDGRRHVDPVKVDKSSTTKPSPVGQPVTDYKPAPKPLKVKEPPSPKAQKQEAKPQKVDPKPKKGDRK